MSERRSPSPCPACGEVVDATTVLDLDACPECGTSLRTLFRLARGRSEGGQA